MKIAFTLALLVTLVAAGPEVDPERQTIDDMLALARSGPIDQAMDVSIGGRFAAEAETLTKAAVKILDDPNRTAADERRLYALLSSLRYVGNAMTRRDLARRLDFRYRTFDDPAKHFRERYEFDYPCLKTLIDMNAECVSDFLEIIVNTDDAEKVRLARVGLELAGRRFNYIDSRNGDDRGPRFARAFLTECLQNTSDETQRGRLQKSIDVFVQQIADAKSHQQ
jgi:hypothetical protein